MKVRIMVTLKTALPMNVVPGVTGLDVLKIIGLTEDVPEIAGSPTVPNWSEACEKKFWRISPEKVLASQHSDWINFSASSVRVNEQFITTSAVVAWECLDIIASGPSRAESK